jgi:glutamate synthase (NADPH/NADH) small chain
MADIPYKDKGSILGPLKSLGFVARQAVTVPLEPRPAAANYRGFHVNDWTLCIGCSTCQKVCDNAAITMVRIPGLPVDPVQGVRNERPAIDYGRCCWCGLCVDICPTGSLSLSREYVHTCREDELDSYFVLPDPNGIHGKHFPAGWAKSADADLVDLERQPMQERQASERLGSFGEIVDGFSAQQAILEASRCVQCGMCHDACPTHMHAPEYIRAIWEGDPEEAVRQIYRSNPFAHVCGRVCTHCCESACSIGRRGQPVAIRWLKRYAMDAVSDERVREIAAEGRSDYISGRKVAIIGAGPAGLTAAFDLARNGHAVTVFEALDRPGGMTRYGIPDYRLPGDRLDADIAVIASMGVDIRCNTRVGKDISMQDLERDYDAVVIAIGLQQGRSTRIPGSDHAQVKKAVSLLRKIARGKRLSIPRTAVVIGGGNVAMDIARSLARLQQEEYGEVQVTVAALEDFEHFLADADEIREAREEGIVIHDSRGPQQCVIDDAGQLTGLMTLGVVSIFDSDGRFAPRYDAADVQVYPADMVVESIGQMSDVSLLGEALTERLEWDRGRLHIDAGGRTSEFWLWAAGDMVHGPDVVHAVADGHRIASSIEDYLGSTGGHANE